MQIKRLIQTRVRHAADGIQLVADVNADVQVNVDHRRSSDANLGRDRTTSPPTGSTEGADRGKEQ